MLWSCARSHTSPILCVKTQEDVLENVIGKIPTYIECCFENKHSSDCWICCLHRLLSFHVVLMYYSLFLVIIRRSRSPWRLTQESLLPKLQLTRKTRLRNHLPQLPREKWPRALQKTVSRIRITSLVFGQLWFVVCWTGGGSTVLDVLQWVHVQMILSLRVSG